MSEKPKELKKFIISSKISGNNLMRIALMVDPALKGVKREIFIDQSVLNNLEIKEEE